MHGLEACSLSSILSCVLRPLRARPGAATGSAIQIPCIFLVWSWCVWGSALLEVPRGFVVEWWDVDALGCLVAQCAARLCSARIGCCAAQIGWKITKWTKIRCIPYFFGQKQVYTVLVNRNRPRQSVSQRISGTTRLSSSVLCSLSRKLLGQIGSGKTFMGP